MAHMNQEKKKAIKAELDKVVPKNWKYTLEVHNYSTIVFTIISAPIDLIEMLTGQTAEAVPHRSVNPCYLKEQFNGETLEIMEKINTALNLKNFDKSDYQAGYVHVGHYVDIQIGKWNKPFTVAKEETLKNNIWKYPSKSTYKKTTT